MIAVPYEDKSLPFGEVGERIGAMLFDGHNGAFLRALSAMSENVTEVAGYEILWSPDNKRIAVVAPGWNSPSLHEWNAANGLLLKTFVPDVEDGYLLRYTNMSVDGNGNLLFTTWSPQRSAVVVIDIDSNKPIIEIALPSDYYYLFSWSEDKKTLFASPGNEPNYNTTYVIDMESKAVVGVLPIVVQQSFQHGDFTALKNYESIYITENGRLIGSFLGAIRNYLWNSPFIHWLPDGRVLVIDDYAIYLITTAGKVEWGFATSPQVQGVTWADNTHIDAVLPGDCYDCPGKILDWDTGTNTLANTDRMGEQPPYREDFLQIKSPNGKSIVGISDDGWDIDGIFVPSTAYSDGWITVTDIESNMQLYSQKFDAGIQTAVWSPDSHILAVGLRSTDKYFFGGVKDSAIVLIDPFTGKELGRLEGHGGAIKDLAWSPDGMRLASASDDGTLILWDVSAIGR